MPNIVLTIPAGIFPPASKRHLVARLNAAAVDIEQIGDDPKSRFMCWVLIEEIAYGNWTCGGVDASDMAVPVLTVIHLPVGVLDDGSRSRYATALHEAITSALPTRSGAF